MCEFVVRRIVTFYLHRVEGRLDWRSCQSFDGTVLYPMRKQNKLLYCIEVAILFTGVVIKMGFAHLVAGAFFDQMGLDL